MINRFIAFDVETPNYRNDKMSAIGITVIENGRITKDYYSLVNPEAEFNSFNIGLTGITPEAVADKPNFPSLWKMIEPVMASGILIAHNAQFDMSVLAKCLSFYNISWHSMRSYACTCTMGKSCHPDFPNHKLDTMCDCLNIELDHHNAGSDSRACAELLLDYMKNGADISSFIREYDLKNIRTVKHSFLNANNF